MLKVRLILESYMIQLPKAFPIYAKSSKTLFELTQNKLKSFAFKHPDLIFYDPRDIIIEKNEIQIPKSNGKTT